jgi:hypothetical protein
LVHQLGRVRVDLIALTGDYMTKKAPIEPAMAALQQLTARLRPRYGFVGVFGNHDSASLREQATRLDVRWLSNDAVSLPGLPIVVWGMDCGELSGGDPVRTALSARRLPPGDTALATDERSLRLMLAHYPDALLAGADLGVDLLLAGHTHGGQVRLPIGVPLVNSTGLPLQMSAGVLRHRRSTIAISRGIGMHTVPMRVFCPPHVPVYTLRRGTPPEARDDRVVCVRRF